MSTAGVFAWLGLALHLTLQALFIARAILRPDREPAARIGWVLILLAAPVVGILFYILFGEATIGRRRIAELRASLDRLPPPADEPGNAAHVPPQYAPLFSLGETVNGFPVTGGNRAELLADSAAVIDRLVADIDAARDHIHLLFYIWLPDGSGTKVAEALIRAAGRGVACRAMVDDLGSRLLIRSPLWQQMARGGVTLARALPIGNRLLSPFRGRVDMRNHRKIVVIDNRITYCGSQNCADAAFAIKARFAPWVDAVMRFEGPVVRQNQHLFAGDWMGEGGDDLTGLLTAPPEPTIDGFAAQVIGTGAAVRRSAMPEIFVALIHAARRELIITTPYFVPDEAIQAALCAAPRRGVATTIVFPARNDSWIVAAASRSYYPALIEAGVQVHEFTGGLLHTKSLTLDGEVALIGSANMDRRSFELNSENNILLCDTAATAALRARQQSYLEGSIPVNAEAVSGWNRRQRFWNNAVAMFGPVL